MLCSLVFTNCAIKSNTPISNTGFYFDTIITITLYGGDTSTLFKGCNSLCEKYENLFSTTVSGSDIWNINHAGGQTVTVNPETAYLVNEALSYCKLSDGALDITIEPLSELWDFDGQSTSDSPVIPTDAAISNLLTHVDYKKVSVDMRGNEVTLKDPKAAITLGCIAKGYIADKLKDYLTDNSVKNAIINLGGNVLTIGAKPDGSPFQIGIQRPFDTTGTPITSVGASDSSVVSSGVYERYFTVDDTLYQHILNPKTGYPYSNNLLSVSILSPTSIEGDGLSTTCFVLGLSDATALINSLPDIDAIFVTDDYEIIDTRTSLN